MDNVNKKFPKGSSKQKEKKEIGEITVDDPLLAYYKKLAINRKPVVVEMRKSRSPSPKKKTPSPKKRSPSPKKKTPSKEKSISSKEKSLSSKEKSLSPKKASPKSFSKMSVVELRFECKQRKIKECQGSKYMKKDDLLKLLAKEKSISFKEKSISPKKASPKKKSVSPKKASPLEFAGVKEKSPPKKKVIKKTSPKKSAATQRVLGEEELSPPKQKMYKPKKSPSPKKSTKGKQEEGESSSISLPSMKMKSSKKDKSDSFEIEISCFEPGQECSDLEFCDADKIECVPKSSKSNKDFILQIPSKKTRIIGSESKLKSLKEKYGGAIIRPKPEILKIVSDGGMLKKATKDASPVFLDFEKDYDKIPEMSDTEKKDIDKFIKESIKTQSNIKVKSPKKMTQAPIFMPKLSNKALEEYAKLEETVKECLENL